MFKKLTSNRDPRDTLWSELRKVFSGRYGRAASESRDFINRHPRAVFTAMLVSMALSITLSFTVFRNKEPAVKIKPVSLNKASPVSSGFKDLILAGETLRQTIVLKQQVDSLLTKKQLDKTDSARLEKALDRLQQLNKYLPK